VKRRQGFFSALREVPQVKWGAGVVFGVVWAEGGSHFTKIKKNRFRFWGGLYHFLDKIKCSRRGKDFRRLEVEKKNRFYDPREYRRGSIYFLSLD